MRALLWSECGSVMYKIYPLLFYLDHLEVKMIEIGTKPKGQNTQQCKIITALKFLKQNNNNTFVCAVLILLEAFVFFPLCCLDFKVMMILLLLIFLF